MATRIISVLRIFTPGIIEHLKTSPKSEHNGKAVHCAVIKFFKSIVCNFSTGLGPKAILEKDTIESGLLTLMDFAPQMERSDLKF